MRTLAAAAIVLSSLMLSAAVGMESADHRNRPLATATGVSNDAGGRVPAVAVQDPGAESASGGECSVICALPSDR